MLDKVRNAWIVVIQRIPPRNSSPCATLTTVIVALHIGSQPTLIMTSRGPCRALEALRTQSAKTGSPELSVGGGLDTGELALAPAAPVLVVPHASHRLWVPEPLRNGRGPQIRLADTA